MAGADVEVDARTVVVTATAPPGATVPPTDDPIACPSGVAVTVGITSSGELAVPGDALPSVITLMAEALSELASIESDGTAAMSLPAVPDNAPGDPEEQSDSP